jgi:hypothetical protein
MLTSPKIVVFFLYDGSGSPLTGVSPTFITYLDDTGTPAAQPTITEIGGGAYRFTPDFSGNPQLGFAYVVDGTVSANPRLVNGYARPEDYFPDLIGNMSTVTFGRWQIFTTGPDANHLVLFEADGITVLQKFQLQDPGGIPTTVNPFTRVPI